MDLENPRHEPYQSQEEVIDYLCKNEYVYALAQDIVSVGINPLEMMAVISISNDANIKKTYVVAEGNRRLCALKLLYDPELAPSEDRKNFENLHKLWTPFDTVPVIIFENKESVKEWLERIHGGLQGGIGRKQWSSEQKTRFTGDIKNLIAQQLLDHAQMNNMITPEERANKISIVQRFISNPLFKDALGIDTSKSNELRRIRPIGDFDLILKKFIDDLKSKKIHTRFNAPDINKYSHDLRTIEGIGNTVIPPQALNSSDQEQKPTNSSQKPQPPARPRHLKYNDNIEKSLRNLSNYKLSSLFNSLHQIAVAGHCPLLTIGVWAFIESLTALNGRNANIDFVAFLTPEKLEKLGLGNKSNSKTLRECLKRVQENGNTTKHDKQSASFNDQQLISDFEVLHPLIQALIREAQQNP